MLVKGAACGTCLPLTSARGCATPGCTNFLTGAFPARGEKAVYGPRAASGGAPTRHMPAPPRARGAGRARGARTICTNQSPERQRGSTEPQGSTGLVRGGESRRARAGSGCAAAALWAAIQCRAYLERGVWGVAPVGRPSPSDEAPGRRARGHEERVTKTNSARTAASERAAQRARAPPPRRIRLRRGFVEGSNSSIRCAAAWRPVVHALPRIVLRISLLRKIFRVGNDAACSVAAMHVAL